MYWTFMASVIALFFLAYPETRYVVRASTAPLSSP